ncbi:MAG: hypothetical protein JNL08_15165 [Planctomycetes bacterium]|nr:hypothetical protein [Planctomycetota bacterium]
MTKSAVSQANVVTAAREPRPFLFLSPARLPLRHDPIDAAGRATLQAAAEDAVPMLVRSLVNFTIERQNRRALERGNPQPIALSVLNRRRRAARAWLLAVLAGKVDGAARHAVASQWLPTLCGTGPDLRLAAAPARALVEFVRGAITACIFDEANENLLPHAKALHVLETVLSVHLAAVLQVSRASRATAP